MNVVQKIDIVYLWCDGTDPAFNEKREKFLPKDRQLNPQSNAKARFYNNDELKHSLRSLEKYAPWINHIFIVTDHQKPDWINLNHEKITIISHEEIMPPEVLPVFNSFVIEAYIHNVPMWVFNSHCKILSYLVICRSTTRKPNMPT